MARWFYYRSHIGDGYVTDKYEDIKPCALCGKIDEYIGDAESIEELADLINNNPVRYSRLFATELSTIGLNPHNNNGELYI